MKVASSITYLLWNFISGKASEFTSSVCFGIASILTIWKTNTNRSLLLFILLTMYAMKICAVLFLCKLVKDAYIELGRVIPQRNNSLYSTIESWIKLIMFTCLYVWVIHSILDIISFYPAIVLDIAGYHKQADYYSKVVMGRNRR